MEKLKKAEATRKQNAGDDFSKPMGQQPSDSQNLINNKPQETPSGKSSLTPTKREDKSIGGQVKR